MSETKFAVVHFGKSSLLDGYIVHTIVADKDAWAYKQVGGTIVTRDLTEDEAKAMCKLLGNLKGLSEELKNGNR